MKTSPAERSQAAIDSSQNNSSGKTTPKRTKTVTFAALYALVISAMVGGGLFSLPQNMAQYASPGAQVIAWIITGIGMWFIVDTFRILTRVQPQLHDGLYSYAEHGFGKFIGFLVAYGYWICNCFALIAYGVLIMATLNDFFPGVFGSGNNLISTIGSSIIMWVMLAIARLGTHTGAWINVVGTICKLVPVVIFIVVLATMFKPSFFVHQFWNAPVDGTSIMDQVSNTMLVTLWLFVGIEGAVVVSGNARSARDVSRATTAGYISVLIFYILISLLPLGVYSTQSVAGMENPSMSVIMEQAVGPWGALLVNIGVIICVLFAWLVWVILISQMPLFAARDGIFPQSFTKTNKYGAPVTGLLWTGIICQILFIICYFVNGSAWDVMISITSVMAMPCYLLCCLYLWKVVLRSPQECTKRGISTRHGLITAVLGTLFSFYLIYSAGLAYLMVACVLFAIGLPIYFIARRKRAPGEAPFTTKEYCILIAIIIAGIIGIIYTIRSGIF